MYDFLILNPNLILNVVLFFTGFILLFLAPVTFRLRTKKISITPTILKKYNKYEWSMLILGITFVVWNIVSFSSKCNEGYFIYSTDGDGKKTIEKIIPGSYD